MNNKIHPTAVVESTVTLGDGNVIGPYAVLQGEVRIGNGNWIGSHVTIGTPAQHSGRKLELTGSWPQGIVIGDRSVFREYVTVEHPSRDETIIEDEAYFMAFVHISHDCVIRSRAILCHNVQMGGFAEIGEACNIGISAALHQGTTVGALAMIGMGAVLNKDVPPFAKAFGNPVRLSGVNTVGLQRSKYSIEAISQAEAFLREAILPEDPTLRSLVDHYHARRRNFGRPALGLLKA